MNGGKIGKILIQRDESQASKPAKLFYSKLPADIKDHHVLLLDPMLATGGSAVAAVSVMLDAGVPQDHITFVNLIAAPEGVRTLLGKFPHVQAVCGMVDESLNSHKYIVPGIGDFGDRYFGTD
jgi:uracil phosphoribosyltransferase